MNRTFKFGLIPFGPLFAKDADGNEIPGEEPEKNKKPPGGDPDADKKFSQVDLDRYAGNARTEAKKVVEKELLEKYGFKTAAELDAAITAQKAAEAAALTDLDKANKKAERLEQEANALKAKNLKLELQRKFEAKAKDLKLEFVSSKAAEDAFAALDLEKAGEDDKGMEEAIKSLQEDRPFLFGEEVETPEIDATRRSGKGASVTAAKEAVAAKRKDKDYGSL